MADRLERIEAQVRALHAQRATEPFAAQLAKMTTEQLRALERALVASDYARAAGIFNEGGTR
jgi:hypothetical protein